MDAKEIIDRLSTELDKIYAKKAVSWSVNDINNTIFDGLESIIIDYYEELHPQGCGETLLVYSKETNIKDFHITQEQIEEALNKIIKPDEVYKDFIIPGFLGSVKFNEEFKQELIKTIKDETSKP